ncbi:SDR family NAD(P)-dependent oxidoreductase [Variovorax sp. J22P168]|uniref:SDR family oxidoreductase n=1 Tax=Variovorax jilinensis TaxID=3053513 RepID=UPI0025779926|nr:SDR family NAD(P)-dependent oxidoreductase [Variovorax sp. J22P168]MDM0015172.1 SDR family NAD(P)-dependent oxidoreductase [Variovorax sp. J22P168]
MTGAAGGIGLGIARVLAERGARVIAVDRAPQLHEAVRSMSSEGLEVEGAEIDITNEQAVRALIASTQRRHDRLDILVNNAAIHPKNAGERNSVAEISTAQWQEVMSVNLTAVFVLCREALPAMQARRWGRVVNISSRAGRAPVATAGAHYAATKAGIIGLSRMLASEFAGQGITVNCVAPGRISSPLTQQGSAQRQAGLNATIPVGRIGAPEEIGHTVSFLAGEGAAYLTGALIDVNGGTFMP